MKIMSKIIALLEKVAERNYAVCSPLGFYKPKCNKE